MFKDLLYSAYRTLCPKVFTKTTNQIQQAISAGQFTGTYTAPANGMVKITGHCMQCELSNAQSGEAFSIYSGEVIYKSASVFCQKGDTVRWSLSENSGRTTALYFYYSDFETP